MYRLASTQRYLNDKIVLEKRYLSDYRVFYVDLDIEGEKIAYIVDGHHRYFAAAEDGQEPSFINHRSLQVEADQMGHENFLMTHYGDSDLYWLDTGETVW